MKVEGYFFAFIAVFLFVADIVYWFLSYDWTGTTAIAFGGGLATIVAYYLLFTARRMEPRPEDRADAEIAEGAGEVGFFSPFSWWPIAMAGAACVAGLGLIFGTWLLITGAITLMLCVVGLCFEYYAGMNKSRGHMQSHVQDELAEQLALGKGKQIPFGD